jgi:hypothetical protein
MDLARNCQLIYLKTDIKKVMIYEVFFSSFRKFLTILSNTILKWLNIK